MNKRIDQYIAEYEELEELEDENDQNTVRHIEIQLSI
jgi:hypothetical protein